MFVSASASPRLRVPRFVRDVFFLLYRPTTPVSRANKNKSPPLARPRGVILVSYSLVSGVSTSTVFWSSKYVSDLAESRRPCFLTLLLVLVAGGWVSGAPFRSDLVDKYV